MRFCRTPEQEAICAAVGNGDNVMVEALAGCAKSTTIVEACKDIAPRYSVAVIMFNVKNKKDMEAKLKDAGLERKNLSVMTLNGLGHRAIREALRKNLEVEPDKIFDLTKKHCPELKGDDFADVLSLVRTARMQGIIPKGLLGQPLLPDTDETWELICEDEDIDKMFITRARNILRESTQMALKGTVDFDDQIYVSSLIAGAFPKFDTVFVDESQDLSRMNHGQLRKCAREQIVAVGDPHQAIYAWRGADADSMRNLRTLRNAWTECTLSVTFRCPKRVVERQRAFVPLFQAGPDNNEGHIARLEEWTPTGGHRSAILCRNNAPLIKMAFRLLRAGVPATIQGKDIGRSMKRLYNKISNNGQRPIPDTIELLYAQAEEDEAKADKYESLAAILETQGSVDKAMEFFDKQNKDAITLSTGHRAKGMEWDTVYHLEPGLIPSKYAQKLGGSALEQEDNLRYVIETRTKDKLFFVKGEGLALD